jgi:hypothetical protein
LHRPMSSVVGVPAKVIKRSEAAHDSRLLPALTRAQRTGRLTPAEAPVSEAPAWLKGPSLGFIKNTPSRFHSLGRLTARFGTRKLLKKGTGSELMADHATEKRPRRGACTLFQPRVRLR